MRVANFSSLNDFGSSFNEGFPGRFHFGKTGPHFVGIFNGPSLRLQAENTPELIQAFQTFFTQVGLKPYHADPYKYAGEKAETCASRHFRKDAWYD